MPTTLIPQQNKSRVPQPQTGEPNGLRRWTPDEYHRLKKSGFFGEERTELLDGLIWHPEAPDMRRWTLEEYHRLAEMGFFDDERVELLDGRIWKLPPQKTPHFTTVRRTTDALEALFGDGYEVRPQGPLRLPNGSEPEPDVLVVSGTSSDFIKSYPIVTDSLLLVKVSDSTLAKDRGSKLIDYARASIQEYWIVNLVHNQLEVYRQPTPEGIYLESGIYRSGESVAPLNTPGREAAVADLLPPIE